MKKNKRAFKSKKKGKQKKDRKSNLEYFLRHEILNLFKRNPNKAYTSKQVAVESQLYNQVANSKIRSIMDKLAKEGELNYMEKGRYRYGSISKTIIGKIQVTRNGSGFVLVDDGDDIFIPSGNMEKTFDGDIVKAKVISVRKKSGKPEGKILEVVERKRSHFVGTVEESMPGKFFLLPDENRIPFDFFIPSKYLKQAKDGDKVLTELLNWDRRSPEVAVVKVLGEAGKHDTEMHAILYQYGFNPEFPEEVEAEAAKISEKLPAAEIKKRRDMRDVPTFTIDPHDAKDFDDALSFRVLENGRYEVGVHIADVSYYVRSGSKLDREAYQRATSVYLVDRTVPMLPEKLSNRLCSLRPNEEKFTYSAIFEMDDQAKVHKQWIGRTVIYSDHRFAYEEAQETIDGKNDNPHKEVLVKLNDLALKLRAQRMKTGSIEFETNEVKFELDENDKPIRVIKKERLDAHKLIEDFMLLANKAVAKHIGTIFKDPPLPSIYRIHDLPDPEKLSNLGEFAGHFGHEIIFHETSQVSEKLNRLLLSVQGKPEQNVIESVAIRSMAKAVYSTKNIGHFGLGFEYYTHFTSPIRRYPDLMVHRLVTKYQNKEYKENPVVMEEMAKHCSDRERVATEAERASIKYKQVEFLSERIGKEFNGIISGVIERGIFVELDDNMCEGFVAAHTIEDDFFVFEAEKYRMVGKDTGQVLQLGDPVRIEIDGADLKRRTVDFLLVEKLGEEK